MTERQRKIFRGCEFRTAVRRGRTLVLAWPAGWSAVALAQGASPATSQQQGPTAEGSIIQGKIANVSGDKVTLADGTEVMIPSDVMETRRADLKPGATIRVSFEERNGQKVVTGVMVESAE